MDTLLVFGDAVSRHSSKSILQDHDALGGSILCAWNDFLEDRQLLRRLRFLGYAFQLLDQQLSIFR